jgi:hypothetical protein
MLASIRTLFDANAAVYILEADMARLRAIADEADGIVADRIAKTMVKYVPLPPPCVHKGQHSIDHSNPLCVERSSLCIEFVFRPLPQLNSTSEPILHNLRQRAIAFGFTANSCKQSSNVSSYSV